MKQRREPSLAGWVQRGNPVLKSARRTTWFAIFTGLGLIGLAAAAALSWRHATAGDRALAAAMGRARGGAAGAARAIDDMLLGVMPLVQATADDLTQGRLRAADLPGRFREAIARNPVLLGMGAAYEPHAYAPNQRLYAPYVVRQPAGAPLLIRLDERYDYTQFRYRWYGDPILDGAMWHEARFERDGEGMVAIYGAPFYRPGAGRDRDAPLGLVFATIAMESVAHALDAMALGTAGYAMVFAKDGRYISHPRRDFVRQGATVFETAWSSGDTTLHSMAIRAIKGERGVAESFDELTGQSSRIFTEPIPSTGWTLAVVLFLRQFEGDPDTTRQAMFQIALLALAGLVCLGLASLSLLFDHGEGVWWAHAAGLSVLLTAGMLSLWWASDRYPVDEIEDRVKIFDPAGLEQWLRSYARGAGPAGGSTGIRVPTGVFVRSVEFVSGTNVAVAGYVWQKYPKGVPDGVARGFALPEADKPEVKEIFRRRENGQEVIGWSFSATLRQQFSYERYPFDRQEVWVRLRHEAFDQRVILVPDLEAYQLTNPVTRPGVAEDLVLPGWDVLGSFFDFRASRYNANLGLAGFEGQRSPPELYFNVQVRRQFVGPFISNIVPLFVTAAMLFAILLTGSKREEGSSLLGFTAMDVVLGCAALFFVASFQHISLRDRLVSARIMYFEYFYFMTYLALMVGSLNGILFAAPASPRLIAYRNNLIPKLAFWPALLACLLGITFGVLY
jgi:hypothetical protein